MQEGREVVIVKSTKSGTKTAPTRKRIGKISVGVSVPRSSVKRISVRFFAQKRGEQPVLSWLRKLPAEDKKTIGEDIKTVEFGWPIGMPTCRKLKGTKDLYEVRSTLSSNRIARVIFAIEGDEMILLHGFIKKTQTTPQQDINLASDRLREFRE